MAWDTHVKSYDASYRLFLKHYLQSKMPPTVRGDLLFVDDSQGFSSLNQMTNQFAGWGSNFSPAEVGFQYGYPNDRPWWSPYADPAGTIAGALHQNIPNASSFFWVDFTIEEIVPVGDAPTIVTPPAEQAVGAGFSAVFSVTATGDGDITYQWQRDGVALAEGGHYADVTTPTLTVSDVSRTDEGDYRCVVTNGCGSTNSSTAELVVLPTGDVDADGDVNLSDYAACADCLAGPGAAPNPPLPLTEQKCLDVFDFDVDDDVDLSDFREFAVAFDTQ